MPLSYGRSFTSVGRRGPRKCDATIIVVPAKMSREHRMIEPFADHQVREGVISYGVSSYGYDMRVAPEFKIFTNALSAVVDPKRFDPKSFVEFMGDVCIVPPNSFALASSVEY